MSNDSGIRSRHKRRTIPHNKHSIFPGLRLSSDMIAANQSIKPKVAREIRPYTADVKYASYSHPLWIAYDSTSKKLTTLAGSSAQAIRTKNEHEFFQAYRMLVKNKLAYRLKRKYWP